MKKVILAGVIAISCTGAVAQEQRASQGRYRYTYTAPAEWMAMQVALATADHQLTSSGPGIGAETRGEAVIEEGQASASYLTDMSSDSDRIFDEMCLGLFGGRYDGDSGAIAMSAERVRIEEARENKIKELYTEYLASLATEDAIKIQEQTARLAATMTDTKIDWGRYAREDATLFIAEQTKSCNQR